MVFRPRSVDCWATRFARNKRLNRKCRVRCDAKFFSTIFVFLVNLVVSDYLAFGGYRPIVLALRRVSF